MIANDFKLAWRNIWRNKRRAVITMSSITVFLFLVIFMGQMNRWTMLNNIDSSVAAYAGYIQITDTAFVDEPIMDNAFDQSLVDVKELQSIEGVKGVYPRIVSGAMASIGVKSKVTGVMGIIPDVDNDLMKLPQKLLSGELLEDGDNQILISEDMSKFYEVSVGDSLILFGQGYFGVNAAGIYRIKGIVTMTPGALSNMVYMPMSACQYFYGAEDKYTAVLVNIDEMADLATFTAEVKAKVTDSSLVVRNWKEVVPEMEQIIALKEQSNNIIAFILLGVVAFGIFGTVVMLYNERLYEFGVLNSIGMRRSKIYLTTMLEIGFLSLLGVLAGVVLVTPLLAYINTNPIKLSGDMAETITKQGFDPILSVGLYPDVYINSALTILFLIFLTTFYILFKVVRFTPLEAMRKK